MEIYYFNTLPSTQAHLLAQIEKGLLTAPVAVWCEEQSAGLGSRGNRWLGGKGNFFASFALPLEMIPEDLPLGSASIYFSFIMKQTLKEFGLKVWLKWPNDFYLDKDKVGGTITKKIDQILVCGMGINLKNSQNGYKALQSDISPQFLLENYLLALEKFPKWKEIFSLYKIEFELSRMFSVHIENDEKSLKNAVLCEDGSLIMEGKRVFSLR
ncbi:MAG: hypothetical protein RL113_610 [Pseudomonadota bacterium]